MKIYLLGRRIKFCPGQVMKYTDAGFCFYAIHRVFLILSLSEDY